MTWKRGVAWGLIGLTLIFIQSFFLFRWLGLSWTIIFIWMEDSRSPKQGPVQPEWLILFIGLVDDLFLMEPFGKGVLIYLAAALVIRIIKKIMGLGKSVKIKVKNF